MRLAYISGGLSPSRTLHRFWGNFRIAGDPDGIPEFAFHALDSRLGDLASMPEFLPATWAFLSSNLHLRELK